MTNNGVLLIAINNGKVDYVKQAIFLAKRVQKYLQLPVSLITNSVSYLRSLSDNDVFDKIIEVYDRETANTRRYYDGSVSSYTASFKNSLRSSAYELSPYDKTLLIDTDYIISNDILKNCFDSKDDFLIYKNSSDIAQVRDEREFQKISDYSIDFYWATVVFFKKTKINQIFFDLVNHIQDNWPHYRKVYRISSPLFRNDYAFSIAIHMINGFQKGDFAKSLPGKMLYTTDKDILIDLSKDNMTFLVEKKNSVGEYTVLKTKSQNIHVMNKFSLERIIDRENNV